VVTRLEGDVEQSIMKFLERAAWTACVLVAASVFAPSHAQTPAPDGVLGLSASASVEIAKDVLAVTFATAREGSDANAVQAELKRALDVALAEARKVSRPGQIDVQTGNFSLFPRYAPPTPAGRSTIDGWQGSAELVVEGRDLAAIGQLTGRIASMTIARVEYRLSREASRRVEADVVAEAIAAFRAKAASYAKLFGYGSYGVREVTVSTNEPQPGPQPMMRMQAADSRGAESLPVEAGRALVTANVNGTIQMK
jgi:predicted secreted protein